MSGSIAIALERYPDTLAREAERRRQHRVWMREGYDGHNRRSVLSSMVRLRRRRRRRLMHHLMRLWRLAC